MFDLVEIQSIFINQDKNRNLFFFKLVESMLLCLLDSLNKMQDLLNAKKLKYVGTISDIVAA